MVSRSYYRWLILRERIDRGRLAMIETDGVDGDGDRSGQAVA